MNKTVLIKESLGRVFRFIKEYLDANPSYPFQFFREPNGFENFLDVEFIFDDSQGAMDETITFGVIPQSNTLVYDSEMLKKDRNRFDYSLLHFVIKRALMQSSDYDETILSYISCVLQLRVIRTAMDNGEGDYLVNAAESVLNLLDMEKYIYVKKNRAWYIDRQNHIIDMHNMANSVFENYLDVDHLSPRIKLVKQVIARVMIPYVSKKMIRKLWKPCDLEEHLVAQLKRQLSGSTNFYDVLGVAYQTIEQLVDKPEYQLSWISRGLIYDRDTVSAAYRN